MVTRPMERDLQGKIITDARKRGCYVVKVIQASRAGVPDILMCHMGRFIAVEVKRLKMKAKPLQNENAELIRKAGGIAVIVDSFEAWKAFCTETEI